MLQIGLKTYSNLDLWSLELSPLSFSRRSRTSSTPGHAPP
jgi:hypothetical protein